jgi:protein-disulfide isomerase
VAIVIIAVGGIWAYVSQPTTTGDQVNQALLLRPGNHSTEQGTRTYPITIVEFGDYECPACGYADPIIQKVVADDPDVRLIFRNFPLSQHPFALIAAETAEAAAAQGKFWEMHTAIYANQNVWTTMQTPLDAFVSMASKLGLDTNRLTQEVNASKYDAVIKQDQADGVALGVDSTPTFYINGKKYAGGLDYNLIQRAIDQARNGGSTQQTAASSTEAAVGASQQ